MTRTSSSSGKRAGKPATPASTTPASSSSSRSSTSSSPRPTDARPAPEQERPAVDEGQGDDAGTARGGFVGQGHQVHQGGQKDQGDHMMPVTRRCAAERAIGPCPRPPVKDGLCEAHWANRRGDREPERAP